jgi:beta-glucosidase/6-phospho-beta-glucosidase/beta-galactosidase
MDRRSFIKNTTLLSAACIFTEGVTSLLQSCSGNASAETIFQGFFLSGFESSNFKWRDHKRRNLIKETEHDYFADFDYKLLHSLGIKTAREGIPWADVDNKGKYNFSCIDPMIKAMNKYGVNAIWDLCHYGYPDDLDPFRNDFTEHFVRYCKAAAEYVASRTKGPYFFLPINEITYFSFIGGEWGWVAPYKTTKEDRFKLRVALCKASIAGVKAIREVVPSARIVNVDPLVNVVAPRDRPDLIKAAHDETYVDSFIAWDILYGKKYPELGGTPEILDIIGATNYSFGQMEYREHGPHKALAVDDDRIVPLCDLLQFTWERYKRPIIIGETSGLVAGRPYWVNDVVEETLAAINRGVNMQGICFFPAVEMPDWNTGEWLHNGFCDIVPIGGKWQRFLYKPYAAQLRNWQIKLNSSGTDNGALNMDDIIKAAKKFNPQPDKNWY